MLSGLCGGLYGWFLYLELLREVRTAVTNNSLCVVIYLAISNTYIEDRVKMYKFLECGLQESIPA